MESEDFWTAVYENGAYKGNELACYNNQGPLLFTSREMAVAFLSDCHWTGRPTNVVKVTVVRAD